MGSKQQLAAIACVCACIVGCGEESVPYISDDDFLTKINVLQNRTFPSRKSGNAHVLVDAQNTASSTIYKNETLPVDAQLLFDGDWIHDSSDRNAFVTAMSSSEVGSLLATLNEPWIDETWLRWDSPELDIEAPTSARIAARLAILRGKVFAIDGDSSKFVTAFQTSHRLASLIETRLVGISLIVSTATRNSAFNAATEIAALGYLDNDAINVLEAASLPSTTEVLRASADGERLFYSLDHDDPDDADPLGRSSKEVFEDHESGYTWIVAKVESIDWEDSDSPIRDMGGLGPASIPFGSMLNVFLNERQSLAGMKAVFEVARFRNTQGRLPTDDEFQSPIDPANGQGFVYRSEVESPAGFILYSKGLDGIDDGGNFNDDHFNRALMTDGVGEDHRVYPSAP